MPNDEEKRIIDEEIAKLPDAIKEYLGSQEFLDDVYYLCEGYELSDEQKQAVADQLMLTFMGLQNIEEVVEDLEKDIPEKDKRERLSGEMTILLEPYIDDIVDIYIRHIKEVEKEALKQTSPAPPPKPAPRNDQTEKESSSTSQNDQKTRSPNPPPLTYNKESGRSQKKEGAEEGKANIMKVIEESETKGAEDKNADK